MKDREHPNCPSCICGKRARVQSGERVAVIDLALIAIAAFLLGAFAGRADLRASRKQKVQTIDRVRLVWSNGRRKS